MADLRVLIVDDDFHVARLHATWVDAVPGFTALAPVGTAALALQAAHSLRPDLVLLDTYLPDTTGLELLRTIDTDAIMLTAAADPESVRTALRRGALGYLIKPFSADDLAAALRGYARYRRVLAGTGSLDQAGVDRARRALLGGGDAPSSAGPSRSRSATETAVLEALAQGPGSARALLSAAEVAAVVGVSRATAQRYLAALAEDGAVEIQLRYGSTGRPEHRYGLPG
ncbi:response regulator [Sinomonas sp. R1AF57]|uniref:response regulator n=1 Tax=Sinomonas sp. R1AF57 TaxID=2020377 RepID=UPI000B615247|nr:response regulator [Sinomonas sp. R1AF57]ASN51535.1 two-component system response regulator [Sinomonas sp. R1AF57]